MATNIMIRNLSERDNEMLSQLMNHLNVNTNSAAFLQAGYEFLNVKRELTHLQDERQEQERTIGQLTSEIFDLKEMIKEYLQVKSNLCRMENNLANAVGEKIG